MRLAGLRGGLVVVAIAALSACGGSDHKTSSARTATEITQSRPAPKRRGPSRTVTSLPAPLVRNPRRAAVERTVALFVAGVERGDAARVCRLLGRPVGSLEGCARAAGMNLHAVPSSDELSVTRIGFAGVRASVKLASGQTLTLVRRGHGWLIARLRP